MKITVDTNILVSATFWNGASERIISKAEAKEFRLVLSNDIIKEYSRVLDYKEIKDKIKDNKLETKRTIKKLELLSTIVKPKTRVKIITEDPDDDMVLECAREGKVDYLISNDKHLLKLKKFEDIPILTPEDFLKKIKFQK